MVIGVSKCPYLFGLSVFQKGIVALICPNEFLYDRVSDQTPSRLVDEILDANKFFSLNRLIIEVLTN